MLHQILARFICRKEQGGNCSRCDQPSQKKPIWCRSRTRQSALMSSFSFIDDLQWPLVLYKTHWRPFQAGHVILEALNWNHLSKIISFHLFIWLSYFWLHRWTRWRESFYRANRLILCLTSNSLTHIIPPGEECDFFSHAVRCVLSSFRFFMV